jgi:hypothetical protein
MLPRIYDTKKSQADPTLMLRALTDEILTSGFAVVDDVSKTEKGSHVVGGIPVTAVSAL